MSFVIVCKNLQFVLSYSIWQFQHGGLKFELLDLVVGRYLGVFVNKYYESAISIHKVDFAHPII